MPVKQIRMYLIRRRRYSSKGVSFLCANGSWNSSTTFPRLFPKVITSKRSADRLVKKLTREDNLHFYNIRFEEWAWWISHAVTLKQK